MIDFNMENIDFNLPTQTPSIIKVIGVGGGGGNAVNHMHREGIHDVNFVVCNTDAKALADSRVPFKLQLGKEGLGAGNKPESGKAAAEESIEDIKALFSDGTKMAFITAGMGGGTGTGASPVIARVAREMGILTVGIVTIPFLFEGRPKIAQALEGVEQISKHVDALLVINNERLRQIYSDLSLVNAFAKADDTLSVAAKSIAEIITMHGIMNLDFNDVKTVLSNGGVALMSSGYGEGEGRVTKAINNALHSPLLNNNDIFKSKKVLISIFFSEDGSDNEFMMEEMDEVHNFMTKFQKDVVTKTGMSTEPGLGNKVKITILATGFGLQDLEMEGNPASQSTQAEDDEKEQKITERIAELYGNPGGQYRPKRHHHIYIFNTDDLDNDDLISDIEATATHNRTKEQLTKMQEKRKTADEKPVLPGQTITFS